MYHIYQFWQQFLIITINASLDVSERFTVQNKIYYDISMCMFLKLFFNKYGKKNMVKNVFSILVLKKITNWYTHFFLKSFKWKGYNMFGK